MFARNGISPALFSRSQLVNLFNFFPGGGSAIRKLLIENQIDLRILHSDEVDIFNCLYEKELVTKQQIGQWRTELQRQFPEKEDLRIKRIITHLILKEYDVKHIAYIPDGHKRWAEKNPPLSGADSHERAYMLSYTKMIPSFVEKLFVHHQLHTTSIWFYDKNNLDKDNKLTLLMLNQVKQSLIHLEELAKKLQIRIFNIGSMDLSHPDYEVRDKLCEIFAKINFLQEKTKHCTRHHLIIGTNYSTVDDKNRMCRKALKDTISEDKDELVSLFPFSDMGMQPYSAPDILIRCGEPAIDKQENFLLQKPKFQMALTSVLAPEFDHVDEVVLAFSNQMQLEEGLTPRAKL